MYLVSLKLYDQLIRGLLCCMSPPFLSHMRTTAKHSGARHGTWHVPSEGCQKYPSGPITSQRLDRLCSNLASVSVQVAMIFTQVRRGMHMHVRTCTHLFNISETAGRIALKFGVWLGTHILRALHASGGCICTCARSHPFSMPRELLGGLF